MDEQSLGAHPLRPVVRIGNTVRRPVHWWTPAVHALLRHLESVGFPYSPRVLDIDADGREVLTYLPGESGGAGWAKILPDAGLRAFARMLREYHDAVADFRAPAECEWSSGDRGLPAGRIVCHGDFGPWNVVWRDAAPVGLIDWDMARPASADFDVLYALEYAAPFRDDEQAMTWHRFAAPPNRQHRIASFLDSYGTSAIPDLARRVADLQRTVGRHEAYLAARGVEPQVTWVADGDLDEIARRARWTETHAALVE